MNNRIAIAVRTCCLLSIVLCLKGSVAFAPAAPPKLPCQVKTATRTWKFTDVSIDNRSTLPLKVGAFTIHVDLTKVQAVSFDAEKVHVELLKGTYDGTLAEKDAKLKGEYPAIGSVDVPLQAVKQIVFGNADSPEFIRPKGYVARVLDTLGTEFVLCDFRANQSQEIKGKVGQADLVFPFEGLKTIMTLPDHKASAKGEEAKLATFRITAAGDENTIELTMPFGSTFSGVTVSGPVSLAASDVKSISLLESVDVQAEDADKQDEFKVEGGQTTTVRLPERGGERRGRFQASVTDTSNVVHRVANLAFRSEGRSVGMINRIVDGRATALPVATDSVVWRVWFTRIDRWDVSTKKDSVMPEIRLYLRDGTSRTGALGTLGLFQFGGLSDCKLVGSCGLARYAIDFSNVRSVTIKHHDEESDQPYQIWYDGNWVSTCSHGRGVEYYTAAFLDKGQAKPTAELTDKGGNKIRIRRPSLIAGGLDSSNWYSTGGGPVTTWFADPVDELRVQRGAVAVTVPFGQVGELAGITRLPEQNKDKKAAFMCRVQIADELTGPVTIQAPDIAYDFHSYRIVGMTDLGCVSADVADLKSVRVTGEPSQPVRERLTGPKTTVKSASGLQWEIYNLTETTLKGLQVGLGKYDLPMANIAGLSVRKCDPAKKAMTVCLTMTRGDELTGWLVEGTSFEGSSIFGKAVVRLQEGVEVVFANRGDGGDAKTPNEPSITIVDTNSVKWQVSNIKCDGSERIPLKVDELTLQLDQTKIARIEVTKWPKDHPNPLARVHLKAGEILDGTLMVTKDGSITGENRLGRLSLAFKDVKALAFDSPAKAN